MNLKQQSTVKIEDKPVEVAIVKQQLLNSELIPSNWSIKPDKDDKIEATNLNTGRVFNGTVAEFNQFLKG